MAVSSCIFFLRNLPFEKNSFDVTSVPIVIGCGDSGASPEEEKSVPYFLKSSESGRVRRSRRRQKRRQSFSFYSVVLFTPE